MAAASSLLSIHSLPTLKFTRAASLIARAAAPTPSPPPPPPEPARTGSGFGGGDGENGKRRRKGKERSAVVRRTPIDRPPLVPEQPPPPQSGNESAFLLTWLGLGSLILVEGLALAASGFLPQEWDNFLVKYLYPSFTPTVFLFVGGTVVYGVVKYLELEKMKS